MATVVPYDIIRLRMIPTLSINRDNGKTTIQELLDGLFDELLDSEVISKDCESLEIKKVDYGYMLKGDISIKVWNEDNTTYDSIVEIYISTA